MSCRRSPTTTQLSSNKRIIINKLGPDHNNLLDVHWVAQAKPVVQGAFLS